jgi:ketosteroid isomerase-like protein
MPRMSARATVVFLAVLALLWVLLPRLRPASDDISAVRATEARLIQASAQGDIPALDAMIASDFSTVDGGGNRENRTEFLGNLGTDPWKIESLRQENLQIRFYGDMAIVTGANDVQERNAAGRSRSEAYSFLHVFQKRDGRWMLIAGMGSPFANP